MCHKKYLVITDKNKFKDCISIANNIKEKIGYIQAFKFEYI